MDFNKQEVDEMIISYEFFYLKRNGNFSEKKKGTVMSLLIKDIKKREKEQRNSRTCIYHEKKI